MPHLPANLHVVQRYRISLDDQDQGEERAATNRPAAASSTTTTTVTEARILAAVQQPPAVNLILLRGEVAHSIEVGGRLNLIDVLLFRLLERHLQDRPIMNEFSLVLASALPPRMGYVQEVIVLLQEDTTHSDICWDARFLGHPLQSCPLDQCQRTQRLLSQDWQEAGWALSINGAPDVHTPRNFFPGDFVQPFQGLRTPACTPTRALELVPALQPLAWPLRLSDGSRHLLRALRQRRQQMGAHFLDVGIIHILGPTHGPVRIRTGLHARPDATHLQTAVRRLAGFPQPLEFAATSESGEMEAPFH